MVLAIVPPEEGAALQRTTGRDLPCARAEPTFHVHDLQSAPPVFSISSRAHQGTLPHCPPVPGRVPAQHALAANGLFVHSGLFHVVPDTCQTRV